MYKVVLQDCRASCIWLCMQLKTAVWKEWNKVVPFLSLIQLSLTCSTCTCMVNEAIVVNYTTKCWSKQHAILCVWQVKLSVILTYCKACVYWMAGAVLLMNCILNGFAVASNFWLADWSNAEDRASPNSTVDMWVTLWISNEQGHFWGHLDLVDVLFHMQRLLPQYIFCTGIRSGIFCHLCLSILGFGNHQRIKHHSQQDAHKHSPLTNVIFWYNTSWQNPEPILKGYLQHWWGYSQIYWWLSRSLIDGSQCDPGGFYYHSCFHRGHPSTRDLLLVCSGMQSYLIWFGALSFLLGDFTHLMF